MSNPNDIFARLKQQSAPSSEKTVGTTFVEPSQNTSIANQVNTSVSTIAVTNELVKQALMVPGQEELLQPTEQDLTYVASVFRNKQLQDIDKVTYNVISDIGKVESQNFNNELKQFTSKISAVKAPGLFELIDELQKDVNKADLEGIWKKTVNVKPTMLARMMAFFNPSAENESRITQFRGIYELLTEKGKGLEAKIGTIERKLLEQKRDQETNIKDLDKSFEICFRAFEDLRSQYFLIRYLEVDFAKRLEIFKQSQPNITEFTISKAVTEYEGIAQDIQSKRLSIEGAIMRLPITVKQNQQLVASCKSLLKEIDFTIQSSFPTIRQNLAGLGIALNVQQGLVGTQNVKKLANQSSHLLMEVVGDIAEKSLSLNADSRLADSEVVLSLVEGLRTMSDRLSAAAHANQEKLKQAESNNRAAADTLKQVM